MAGRVTAAAHACLAKNPTAGGRSQEGAEQQHTAQVRLTYLYLEAKLFPGVLVDCTLTATFYQSSCSS